MKRTMMQVYVKGSNQAVAFYHCELDVYGQLLAASEAVSMEHEQGEPIPCSFVCILGGTRGEG